MFQRRDFPHAAVSKYLYKDALYFTFNDKEIKYEVH